MKKLFWILLFFFSFFLSEASHMVSGYIGYKCLGGTTYQITFYNYANTCNDAYDQDTMTIHFGDGTAQTVARINGVVIGGFAEGVPVCNCRKLCLYQATHTYSASGGVHYRISVDDPARMAQIANMANSQNQDFYVYSDIILTGNSGDSLISPVITNPLACEYACSGQCYTYNLGAYSPIGDSIAYFIGNCLGTGGAVAGGYFIPGGSSIDPSTGTFKWCSPPNINPGDTGIYNFAFILVAYRRIVQLNGRPAMVVVDTTEFELEVLVPSACHNDPPTVSGPSDTCVEAGDLLKLNYTASDVLGDQINLIATGAPFITSPPATTNGPGPGNPVSLTFTWSTNCTEVRRYEYPLLVTATTTTAPLSAYQATTIHIVGPAPTNLTATPSGNGIQLNWNPSICSQVVGYDIYRHVGCYKWVHGPCETGVPSYTGYTLIGTTNCPPSTCTSFLDNNGGRGLTPGVYYDYMVVAIYPLPDGSLSYASADTCVKLRRDVPIITNVSVTNTGAVNGTNFIRWVKPLDDPNDLDTIADPGPYSYILKRANGINGNSFSTIATFSAPYFNSPIDTSFTDTPLNTQSNGYNYIVDFYSNSNFIGSSPSASSLYLSIQPDNNMLHLSWHSTIPWTDSSYSIYRTYPPPVTFLATVPGTQTTYTDSNLTNLKNFCYYVESKSYYADPSIAHPLFDSSEVMCGTPKDTIPPCPPHLTVTPKCSLYQDSLVWDNPDYFCPKVDNRILYYEVYYSPSTTQESQLLSTIYNLKDTSYIYDSIYSIAGCFSVIAVDSFMNKSPVNTVCVDNCPEYELPNIFTPNGDNKNDEFIPILPYRFIKDIDINIYNRWGQIVFHTINPMINWNGNDQNSGRACPDGVYYYVCQVNEIHLNGIQSVELKGFVQILR